MTSEEKIQYLFSILQSHDCITHSGYRNRVMTLVYTQDSGDTMYWEWANSSHMPQFIKDGKLNDWGQPRADPL